MLAAPDILPVTPRAPRARRHPPWSRSRCRFRPSSSSARRRARRGGCGSISASTPTCSPPRRELEFFNNGDRFRELGTDWYRAQFEGWNGEKIVGEATPGYMFWRHRPAVVAERIEQTLPGVRLIATLRNPIDRAQSAMVHHIEGGSLPGDSVLVELVKQTEPERDPLGIIAGGWYAASLEPYRERFGDRLLVVLHDDVDDDPRGVYDDALRHIGATPDFVPPEFERVRFSHQQRPVDRARPPAAHARRAARDVGLLRATTWPGSSRCSAATCRSGIRTAESRPNQSAAAVIHPNSDVTRTPTSRSHNGDMTSLNASQNAS